jgi:hypothetical protein
MIAYPDDRATRAEAEELDLPDVVVIRDIVRIVEVLNLKKKGFFNSKSVLAGSMALRCFKSPRFTVYDTDFSTSEEIARPPGGMTDFLRYTDDDLVIEPASLVPTSDGPTMWESAPITFDPIFTGLVPGRDDRTFKADVSYRGLVLPGVEMPLRAPYRLGIWDEDPVVYIMDPHETVAEKILGWCAHRLVKHYADLAFIAVVSNPTLPARGIELDYRKARDALDAKLEIMRALQPKVYAPFPNVDAVIADLARDPQFSRQQWLKIIYLRQHRDRFTQQFLQHAVQELLVPGMKGR